MKNQMHKTANSQRFGTDIDKRDACLTRASN